MPPALTLSGPRMLIARRTRASTADGAAGPGRAGRRLTSSPISGIVAAQSSTGLARLGPSAGTRVSWARGGPGRPVDNGGRARCRRRAGQPPVRRDARALPCACKCLCLQVLCSQVLCGSTVRAGVAAGTLLWEPGGAPQALQGQAPGVPSRSAGTKSDQAEAGTVTGTDRARGPVGRVAVIMPTYNERENLEPITARVRAAVPDADLLVVDDNSPDGTGEHRRQAGRRGSRRPRAAPAGQGGPRRGVHRRVRLGAGAGLRRAGRDGRGRLPPARAAAPAAGRAARTPTWCSAPAGCPAGPCGNWPKSREMLSRGGNIYARLMLGIRLQDATGGYRAYRAGDAAGDRPGRGAVAGLLLPGRPGPAR